MGLNWVCFHQVSNWIYFHNPLYYMILRSFDFFGNWVCFAYFAYNFVRNLSYICIVCRILYFGTMKNQKIIYDFVLKIWDFEHLILLIGYELMFSVYL